MTSTEPSSSARDRRPAIGADECPRCGQKYDLDGCGCPPEPSSSARVTAEQAKANTDAAFAVGALCGALGAVGREVIGAKIQRRFEEVLAAQEADDDNG